MPKREDSIRGADDIAQAFPDLQVPEDETEKERKARQERAYVALMGTFSTGDGLIKHRDPIHSTIVWAGIIAFWGGMAIASNQGAGWWSIAWGIGAGFAISMPFLLPYAAFRWVQRWWVPAAYARYEDRCLERNDRFWEKELQARKEVERRKRDGYPWMFQWGPWPVVFAAMFIAILIWSAL